ncbi:MAG: hypothetical protein ACP5UN_00740 [Candidatus Micrarchaeia archaeon]
MDDDYQKYLKLLNSIFENTNTQQIQYIDLSSISEIKNVKSISYSEAVSLIEKVEGKRYVKEVAKEKAEAAKGVENIPPHIISSGLQQAQYTQTSAPIQIVTKQKISGFDKFKEKMLSATKSLKVGNKSKIVKEKISIKDLVLPSLSISDQILELERIIEGLNEKVFDSEHLEVVAEEVYGLQMVIEGEQKAKKAAVSELERSLIALRNQRLSDALAILSKYESEL